MAGTSTRLVARLPASSAVLPVALQRTDPSLAQTSDDEQLDFSLPKALPSKQPNTACECAPNVAALRRMRSRMAHQCSIM